MYAEWYYIRGAEGLAVTPDDIQRALVKKRDPATLRVSDNSGEHRIEFAPFASSIALSLDGQCVHHAKVEMDTDDDPELFDDVAEVFESFGFEASELPPHRESSA